jgi:hypothetical protein
MTPQSAERPKCWGGMQRSNGDINRRKADFVQTVVMSQDNEVSFVPEHHLALILRVQKFYRAKNLLLLMGHIGLPPSVPPPVVR